MKLWESIVLGIIQALGEFLPISSSGHLALAQSLFGLDTVENALAFDVLLHLGTLISVLAVFRRDVLLVLKAALSLIAKLFSSKRRAAGLTPYERLALCLAVALIPLVPATLLSDRIEALMKLPAVVGALLFTNGMMLLLSERFSRHCRDGEHMTPLHALIIGLCQAAALLPGISRSGATVTGGLSQGFTREFSVKFSFLLSIPTVFGAAILKLPALFSDIPDSHTLGICLAGMLAATLVGIFAIALVSFISKRASFRGFGIYCLMVGGAACLYACLT